MITYRNARAYYQVKSGTGRSFHARLLRYVGAPEAKPQEFIVLIRDQNTCLRNSDLEPKLLEDLRKSIDTLLDQEARMRLDEIRNS